MYRPIRRCFSIFAGQRSCGVKKFRQILPGSKFRIAVGPPVEPSIARTWPADILTIDGQIQKTFHILIPRWRLTQVAAILLHLGDKLDLAPREPAAKMWTHQIQLTIADFILEAHDVHHPIGMGSYYEDQKAEAVRRADEFRNVRVPKYFKWFEAVLARNTAGPSHLVGDRLSYADLSLFQSVEGMKFAFPKLMARIEGDYPNMMMLHGMVSSLPQIAEYLGSERRLPPNNSNIFRHYPELDV